MKCTQYEFCGQATLKNARALIFFLSRAGRGVATDFDQDTKVLKLFSGVALVPIRLPLKACRGRFNVPDSCVPSSI